RFNGRDIGRSAELPQVVGVLAPGTKAEAEVIRDGKRRTLKVTVGELPEDESATPTSKPGKTGGNSLGLTVESLSAEQRRTLGVEQGVLVSAVSDGPAARAGIRRGDVLVSLEGKPVDSPAALEKIVKNLPAKGAVPVLIHRDGGPRFLALKLGD